MFLSQAENNVNAAKHCCRILEGEVNLAQRLGFLAGLHPFPPEGTDQKKTNRITYLLKSGSV